MTVRKRPGESPDDSPAPPRKRANLATADKDGLRLFLASSFSDLSGHEEAARERFDIKNSKEKNK